MSATRSVSAAELVARALVDVASVATGEQRLYLTRYLGLELGEIFDALLARATVVVRLEGGAHLRVVPAGSALLIPYLVVSAQDNGQNRGTQGYAALLRTEFAAGALDEERRVLLVLDANPVETVRSAAQDAAKLDRLSWRQLCEDAAVEARGTPAAELADAVAGDLAPLRGDGGLLERFSQFCATPWSTARAAGETLHTLGVYLSDPGAGTDTTRLKRGSRWRRDLDRWSGPSEDLRGRLERKLGEGAPGVAKVLRAVGPLGLDYAAFTLDDLAEQTQRTPPLFRRPVQVRGARASLSRGNAVALWVSPDASEISIRVAGDLVGGERIEAYWGEVRSATSPVEDDGSSLIVVDHDGWQFARFHLFAEGEVVDELVVACYRAEGSWFPVESSLAVEPDAAAFRVDDEPAGLAVAPGGGVLGPVPIDSPELGPDLSEQPVIAAATRQGESHQLPLLLVGEDVDPEGGGGGDSDTDGEDADEASDADVDGDGSAGRPGSTHDSPVHAHLASVRSHPGDREREIAFNARATDWPITVGGEVFRLATQEIGGLDGLELERAILSDPGRWAYTATGLPDGGLRIGPDPVLERLSLASVDTEALTDFRAARRTFFGALEESGSVYALATGEARAEAIGYVDAYAALLASLPRSGRYQPEFDRIVLLDSVIDTSSGNRYIAPTNALTVAFYLSFAEAARSWCDGGQDLPLAQDVATIRPDFLMPMFLAGRTWYEVTPLRPFLWRAFHAIPEHGAVPGDEAGLIAERMRFFLSVHPAYDDWKQTLSVSVLEPGSGAAFIDALRRFFRIDYAKEAYTRPKLDVHLLTPEGQVPRDVEDFLAGGEEGRAIDPLIRSRVRISGRRLDDGLPFSHLTFVFRTPTSRSPEPQDMTRRASSLYVGGLAAGPGRAVEEGANERRFAWGTFGMGTSGQIPGGRAAQLLPAIARVVLELVGGQPRELLREGVTRMATTSVPREFMPDEYKQSVWVVHLDHVLGLEAFAPDGPGLGRYLIDYVDVAGATGLGGVTATARVDPYRDAVTHALADLERLEPRGLERILGLLNSVSGKWALRLLRDNTEKIRERIGTVATIAILEELDGSFERADGVGVLVPLEELFDRMAALGITRPESRSADDLLYIWVPFAEGDVHLRGRLIEVKYRSRGRPDLAEARQEIENTEAWLSDIFSSDNPGRLFRARDLAEMIRSSSSRGTAFELIPRIDRDRLESALGRVAAGEYRLDFAFWVADSKLIGDVVSVELESDAGAVRSRLPGAGLDAGLIRVGRRVLNAIASGDRLEVPGEWQAPTFAPPDADGTEPASDAERTPARSARAQGGAEAPAAQGTATAEEVRRLARDLDAAVMKYGLELEPFQPSLAQVGPSVIRFRARPLGKQSLDGIARRAADIGREVGASEGVLVSQEPFYITIDVPRQEREIVRYSDHAHLLGEAEPGALRFLVGMAASGEVRVADVARLPHLLIAGATGAGKSVFLRSLLCSLLDQHGAMDLSILLVDPKQVDFLPFEDLPHLVDGRIIFDPGEAVDALGEVISRELERRRPVLKRAGVTSVLEYYEAGGSPRELPQIVVVVDEFADLASTLGRGQRAEFMALIQRYGQVTRAFGIHLVLATQRPSVQVITGDIKANMTARVALKVQSSQDSVTILGHGGAERLRDKGDLLFEHAGGNERLQGFLVTPSDVAASVRRWNRP